MRRFVVWILLGSIAVNAALGIYALLVGGPGPIQGKILVTSLCFSGASALALACAPAWERGRLGPVPPVGMAASVAGFALLAASAWLEFDVEPLWKTGVTLVVLGAAAAYACLLALTRLAPRFRWAFWSALLLTFVLAGLLVSLIWGEWSSEWFSRWLGVVAVLVAAFTAATPILHRVSRQELAAPAATQARRVAFCPSCGGPVAPAADEEAACSRCGLRFRVRFLS